MHTKILALLAAALLFASLSRADETAHAKILKERDAVLSQILAEREGRVSSGLVDEDAVLSARLALLTFRRDTAQSKADKIKQQELIVAIYPKKIATLKARFEAGVTGHEEVLLATDAQLQAQQILEELKADEKKG